RVPPVSARDVGYPPGKAHRKRRIEDMASMIRIAHSSAELAPGEISGLDRARIAAWAAALIAGEAQGLHETFMAKGGAAPDFVWTPPVDRLSAAQLRFLLRYWSELAGTRAMPRAKEIDALEM